MWYILSFFHTHYTAKHSAQHMLSLNFSEIQTQKLHWRKFTYIMTKLFILTVIVLMLSGEYFNIQTSLSAHLIHSNTQDPSQTQTIFMISQIHRFFDSKKLILDCLQQVSNKATYNCLSVRMLSVILTECICAMAVPQACITLLTKLSSKC